MAEIKSSDQQAALDSIHLDTRYNYWIGLQKDDVGEWVWQHSQQKIGTWTNWGPGLPDNFNHQNEWCTETYYKKKIFSGKWMWNDVPCATTVGTMSHEIRPLCQADMIEQ